MLRTKTEPRSCSGIGAKLRIARNAEVGDALSDGLGRFGGNGDHGDVAARFGQGAFHFRDVANDDALPGLPDDGGRVVEDCGDLEAALARGDERRRTHARGNQIPRSRSASHALILRPRRAARQADRSHNPGPAGRAAPARRGPCGSACWRSYGPSSAASPCEVIVVLPLAAAWRGHDGRRRAAGIETSPSGSAASGRLESSLRSIMRSPRAQRARRRPRRSCARHRSRCGPR